MVYIPIDIFVTIVWALLSIVMGVKQYNAVVGKDSTDTVISLTVMAIFLAPIWLIGVVIRYVFVEKWK